MKTLYAILLVLSVAANALLVQQRMARRPDTGSPEGGTERHVVDGAARDVSSGDQATTDQAAATGEDELWGSLQSADLTTLIANLRAAGFREDEVVAIARTIVADRFAPKRAALVASMGSVKYWDTRGMRTASAASWAGFRTLMREQEEILREAFGGEVPMSAGQRRMLAEMYGPLPNEKLTALSRITADYSEMNSEIFREISGTPPMPWDREKLALLETEKKKDIEAALTSAEQESYRLYGHGVASAMRRELAGFNPSEAEFRTILALRTESEAPFSGSYHFMDSTVAERRIAAANELKRKLEAALGETRYAEYEMVTDRRYRQAGEIAIRYNLPETRARETYALSRDIEARMVEIDNDRQTAGPERQAAYAALAKDARERLNALLTPEGAETFRNSSGNWLRMLETRGGRR